MNWNLAAVVFMLSGLLNRGAPLQTLTLNSQLKLSPEASDPICTYFYPPIEDEEDEENYHRYPSVPKYIDWEPLDPLDPKQATNGCSNTLPSACCPLSPLGQSCGCGGKPSEATRLHIIQAILSETDLYAVLGVQHVAGPIEQQALRRAYLTRSRKCHPE